MRARPYIALLVIALLATACSNSSDPTSLTYQPGTPSDPGEGELYTGTAIGQRAPGFTLEDSFGTDRTLADAQGEPVILYFWSSSCGYCDLVAPDIQALHEAYADQVTVLSINLSDTPTMINSYLDQRELTYPALQCTNAVQTAYAIYSIPKALVLDSEGVVQFNGYPTDITTDFINGLLQ